MVAGWLFNWFILYAKNPSPKHYNLLHYVDDDDDDENV